MGDRELLGQGREAEVFLQADGTVLKLMRDPSDTPRVLREATALEALAAHGHVAPAVLGVVTVDGRPGLVMDRIAGDDLLAVLARRPFSVLTAGKVMGVAHAAMHDCVAPVALPDLNDGLRERISSAVALPDDVRVDSLAILDGLPHGDRLCHGDLHVGNILGSWSAPVIIDWGDASRGDPVADVARTELLHRFGDPPPGTPPPDPHARTDRPEAPRRSLPRRLSHLPPDRSAAPGALAHRSRRSPLVRAGPFRAPKILRFLRQQLARRPYTTSP